MLWRKRHFLNLRPNEVVSQERENYKKIPAQKIPNIILPNLLIFVVIP